jgi:hypothetical protein
MPLGFRDVKRDGIEPRVATTIVSVPEIDRPARESVGNGSLPTSGEIGANELIC